MSDGLEVTVSSTVRETADVVARLADDNGTALTALANELGIDKSTAPMFS